MGKTSKPISILCIGLEETAELAALREQGHTVEYIDEKSLGEASGYDVLIGAKCWRYLPGISEKWLPQLLKEVRATQPVKPKKVKKNDKG